ncbi:MAG TPA: glycosyltransferase, partial [Victivallales bacterium]|nr:glycosyltransferase [Victivallales bacterium]
FLLVYLNTEEFWKVYVTFFPFVLCIEIPLYLIIIISYLRIFYSDIFSSIKKISVYHPNVTCILTCYNEGKDVIYTIKSLIEQLYPGNIEILVMVDGANINKLTYESASKFAKEYHFHNKRTSRYIKLIPKKQRGGMVSSNNLGLQLAKGEIIIKMDGDCSADNDLVSCAVATFSNPNIIASSGNIKIRNSKKSIVTRFQAVEYMIGLQLSKTGLAGVNMLNNISGGFGIFRKSFLKKIGGWKNGTAEDLDLTTRIKGYLKQYPHLRIIHSHQATIHTDGPDTWVKLFKQRLRWDGDISYLYFKRYPKLLTPKNMQWKSIFAILWYDFFFCLCVPFMTIIYTIYLFFAFSLGFALTMLIVTYIYYLLTTIILFTIYILFASERKAKDFKFIVMIPFMPIYQYVMRIWTAVATVFELTLSTHKDSSMAPWWVIKKTH